MSSIFCCASIQPFRPRRLDYEARFDAFMAWARFPKVPPPNPGNDSETSPDDLSPLYAVQVVRQINYGPLESTRYFAPLQGKEEAFTELSEDDLIKANFQKLNSYKNFRCAGHDKFFELNLYQKDPANTHHWRANLARPANLIDLRDRKP